MTLRAFGPRSPRLLGPVALVAVLALSACGGPAPTSPASSASSASPAASASPSLAPSSLATAPPSTIPAPGAELATGVDPAQQLIPSSPQGTPVKQAKPAEVKDDSGIPGVKAWNTAGYPGPGTPGSGTLDHTHVTSPVQYAVSPPVGGQHAPIWMNAGIYTEPVPNERAVHDMEHGAVWITYDPSLPAAQVKALQELVLKQKPMDEQGQNGANTNRYIVMSPWAGAKLASPIVVSSWGRQLGVDTAADARLQRFIDTFRNSQKYTPEFGSPVDGVPTGTGGNPAGAGSAVKNPSGTLPDTAGM